MEITLKHIMPFMIPIIAIIMGVGIGMLALWLDHQKKTRIFELHHKERLLAIERGMEVPPLPAELFQNARKPESSPESNLQSGLIMLLLGLAIGTAMALNFDLATAAWALIPLSIGVAKLAFYAIARKKQNAIA